MTAPWAKSTVSGNRSPRTEIDVWRQVPSVCQEHHKASELARPHKCRVVVIPSEQYPDERILQPWVRLVLDVDNEHILEASGQWTLGHTIPRWQTTSGSQYAYSPATIAGLPDARLIQAITLTLLEAGEIAVRPPLLATKDAIRSDINYYAGGITVADGAYDERMGDALRPISHDKSGLPYGIEIQQDIRGMLASAFYLNKLTLPPSESKEMTATETMERIQEYVRQALPLFEPMENDYNGVMMEDTFEMMHRAGFFGPPQNVPQGLRGQNTTFQFESPLHDAIDRKKGAQFIEAKQLLDQAIEMDPTTAAELDARVAFRDALEGMATPAEWLRAQDAANKLAADMVQSRQADQEAATIAAQGQAAKQVGDGAAALAAA